MRTLRVLELYAGIGGMHCAFKRCFSFGDSFSSAFEHGDDEDEDGDNVRNDNNDNHSKKEDSLPFDDYEIVAAVDVNEVAASVYAHNFPSTTYLRKGVEGFTLSDLEGLKVDMITMSPPCQPFTRQGLKKDEGDARTKSFLHFLSLLEQMAARETAPTLILVENVLGFETSATHQTLIETLEKCGFRWREFLLTPTQFGIPNSRLRYYLIGKRNADGGRGANEGGGEGAGSKVDEENDIIDPKTTVSRKNRLPLTNDSPGDLIKDPPPETASFRHYDSIRNRKTDMKESSNSSEPAQKRRKPDDEEEDENVNDEANGTDIESDVDPISKILDDLTQEEEAKFLVPDKVLKRFMVMDVTYPNAKRSCCFTKAYGHYVDGTGSFLQLSSGGQTRDSIYEIIKRRHSAAETTENADAIKPTPLCEHSTADEGKRIKLDSLTEADMELLRSLRLRYFTPSEIARIHCLTPDFDFPASTSRKQRWKVLGNGLNAHVVAVLMRLLLTAEVT